MTNSTANSFWYMPIILIILLAALVIVSCFILYRYNFSRPVNSKKVDLFDENDPQISLKELSAMGIEQSQRCLISKDDNGVEVIGIIYNPTSKVFLFDPKGMSIRVGDVVKVQDLCGHERLVPVVLGNTKVSKNLISQEVNSIISIEYKNN